ncbi:hypothetical protein JCM24511_08310 [Saitozyma sp. JCM 24511]|nr:hypothetical protein JCM24511_08310 [Saitozyma sp. JCM 24511]
MSTNIQDTRIEQMPMHPTISENNYAGVTAEELAAFHSGLSPAKGSNPLSTVETVTSALPPAPALAPALSSSLSSTATDAASAPAPTSSTQPQTQTLPLNGPSDPSNPSEPSLSTTSTLHAESLHSHSSAMSDPTTKHGCGDRYFYAPPSAPAVREEFEGFEVGAEDEVAPVRSGEGRVMGTEEELFGWSGFEVDELLRLMLIAG